MSCISNNSGLEFTDKIDLGKQLYGDIARLCMSNDYADVEFLVEEQILPAHRVILAARSEYFRAMLYGKMLESTQSQISLDLPLGIFKEILKYIYSGTLSLASLKGNDIIDMLGIANQYGFQDLESAISNYLIEHLALQNVCLILDASRLHQLKELVVACNSFLDQNAADFLANDSSKFISKESLEEVLCRDSFIAPETIIFQAILKWSQYNNAEDTTSLMKLVRLPLLELDYLLDVVRPSGFFDPNKILDAIDTRRTSQLPYRSHLLPEENVATAKYLSRCIQGGRCSELLNGNFTTYDENLGYTWHKISKNNDLNDNIVVELGTMYMINHIRMLLWDKDNRAYSYYIEIAGDHLIWNRVVDYSQYNCRSWQYLYFATCPVRYIRIVGTENTENDEFHVVSLEAMYTNDVPKLIDQIVIPKTNVATVKMNATINNADVSISNALINGDPDLGYIQHNVVRGGGTVIRLRQPYQVGSIRFLLLGNKSSSYSFYIETSINGNDWDMVIDERNEIATSWQNLNFAPLPVIFIRIVGTCSDNNWFMCTYPECPSQTSFDANDADQDKEIEMDLETDQSMLNT